MTIPFVNFNAMHAPLKTEMMQAFEQFYDSHWFILGERVKQFEKEYAAFNQTAHAIGVSNGLDALHLALKCLHIGPGDEVIVPSNTYIASALAVSYVGAKPVFVEPKQDTYNIDAAKIAAAITPNTKAIMPVHLYGQACEMDAIMQVAKQNGLFVVEDNAQSQGAAYKGKLTGTFGDMNATSFYPGKNLGALGDAGAITTNHESLAKQAHMLRNYGSEKKYYNEVIGYNMRLDECQAAFLSIKLKQLPTWTSQRQEIASWYDEALRDINEIILPVTAQDATHVYHLYVIRCKQRDAIEHYLKEHGISTLIHYPVPPHLQQAYHSLGYKKGDFSIAEELAETCLSLPIWPGMTIDHVTYVADTLKRYFTSAGN